MWCFFFPVPVQIRTGLRARLRTRTSDLATRRDQPRHTRARVQDGRRGRAATGAGGRARPVPGARHQDGGVSGRETRAVPGRQAVPGAHREESPGARRQAVPGLQDQAHLPRAQVGQVVRRRLVITGKRPAVTAPVHRPSPSRPPPRLDPRCRPSPTLHSGR